MLAMRTDAYRQAAEYRWMPYLARRRPSGPAEASIDVYRVAAQC
jgi:hypothetical protein